MGNKISRWAKRQLPQLSSTGDKLVLMALAVDADADGNCDPEKTSLNMIADDCGISRTTAKTALGRLRDKKLVEVVRRLREDGSHDNNSYRLAIRGGAKSAPPLGQNLPHPQGKNCPTRGSESDPGGAKFDPPLTSGNAEGGSKSDPPTSSLHPSDVVAPRARVHAGTHARTRDAREEPHHNEHATTPRRQTLDDLNDTATKSDTRRLIEAWRAEHTVPPTQRLIDQMTDVVDRAVRAGRDIECLAAALHEWNARPDLFSPKVLPGLYDDAVSRKNAGQDTNRPLIDDHGFPRIDPQHIPDDYLTRTVVDALLGRDVIQPPPCPLDEAFYERGEPVDPQARQEWYTTWSAERLAVRRVEARRALIRAWNMKSGVAS